jgi:hypothetical protein
MLERKRIALYSYNLETVLAEKVETILARGTANTRMRDYYDCCVLEKTYMPSIDKNVFQKALRATSKKRGSEFINCLGILNDGRLVIATVVNASIQKTGKLRVKMKNPAEKKFRFMNNRRQYRVKKRGYGLRNDSVLRRVDCGNDIYRVGSELRYYAARFVMCGR